MHNEEKSVADERLRALKNKIYKYMTSISKIVYIDKLDDIVDKYNNAYLSIIKINPINLKPSTYIDLSVANNGVYLKFKAVGNVGISKYKNIVAKDYTPYWSQGVFVIKNVGSTVPWTYVIEDLNGEETVGMFYEKNCKRQVKQSL